jgi:hypothetical protein
MILLRSTREGIEILEAEKSDQKKKKGKPLRFKKIRDCQFESEKFGFGSIHRYAGNTDIL